MILLSLASLRRKIIKIERAKEKGSRKDKKQRKRFTEMV
jgi:hypothetical protein